MPDLDAAVHPAQVGTETIRLETAMPFRFGVTWKFVFDPLESNSPTISAVPRDDRISTATATSLGTPLIVPALSDKQALEAVPSGAKKFSPRGSVRWEMVVPKMIRSTKRADRVASKNPSTRQIAEAQNTEDSVPGFCGASNSTRSRSIASFLSVKYILVGVALIASAAALLKHFGSGRKDGLEIQTSTQAGGWAREAVTRMDAGFNRSRELVVYRPSLKAADCRFEFDWKPQSAALGWVFRARDTANYYAMTIKLVQERPTPTVSIAHFAVYRGIESGRSEKVLVLPRSEPLLRIRTDIAGPTFTIYVGSNAAEYWTDARIVSGGLGFLEEWHQGSDVQSVRMSFAQGTEIQRDRLYMNAPVQ